MPINAHPDYIAAEGEYLKAQTPEEKIVKLKKMISLAPGHKGAENLRAQLKTRLKKLLEQQEKNKKAGKRSGKNSIKKEDLQAVIVGKTGTGKSSLLSALTNTSPLIADYEFTTKTPEQGMANIGDTQVQLIENPAISSEYYDKGITNTTDTLLLLINSLEEIKEIEKAIEKSPAKKLVVFNKSDLLSSTERRKTEATLKSKYNKYPFVIISITDKENLEELKNKLFQSFGKIRVYTKQPGEKKSPKPIILKPESDVKDVAEKILHGFSKNVKETRIWGPSSKFAGQKVGLSHKLKDLDVVEFKTR